MLNENNFIGFYHEYEEYGFLCNWYPAKFEYAGKSFVNSEQFMMYQKMMTFGQYKVALDILNTTDPQECKNLGRTTVRNWDGTLWDGIRYTTVKRGIKAKFFQNKDLLEQLLKTGEAILAECSSSDKNWGIGLAVDDADRFDVSKWTGQNLLGRALMEVRDEFKKYAMMHERMLMKRSFFDVHDMRSFPLWQLSMNELLRIPKFHNSVAAYAAVCKKFGDVDMIYMPMNDLEEIFRTNNDGSYPVQGFFELKQDLHDIDNNMFILVSGFDAPIYGKVLDTDEIR